MDIAAVAKEIRERIFERIEDDRAMHASAVEEEITSVLKKVAMQPAKTVFFVSDKFPPFLDIDQDVMSLIEQALIQIQPDTFR